MVPLIWLYRRYTIKLTQKTLILLSSSLWNRPRLQTLRLLEEESILPYSTNSSSLLGAFALLLLIGKTLTMRMYVNFLVPSKALLIFISLSHWFIVSSITICERLMSHFEGSRTELCLGWKLTFLVGRWMNPKKAIYRFLILPRLENRSMVYQLALLVLNLLCECLFFNLALPNPLHPRLQHLRSFPIKVHHHHIFIHRLGVWIPLFLMIMKWDQVVNMLDPEPMELRKNLGHWKDVRQMFFKKGVRDIDLNPSPHATLRMESASTALHESLRLPFHSILVTMACLAQHRCPLFIIHHTIFLNQLPMLRLGL